MKRYILLRNNEEYRPMTADELSRFGIVSTDLIWIESESTAWTYPMNIGELKSMVQPVEKSQPGNKAPAYHQSPITPSLQAYKKAIGEDDDFLPANKPEEATYFYQSKGVFHRNKKPVTNSYTVGSGLFGALVLAIGLVLCGFVVVNMMKQFGLRQSANSEAVEIQSETLPVSSTTHAAQASQSSVLPATSIVSVRADSMQTIVAKKPSPPVNAVTANKKTLPKKDTSSRVKSAGPELPPDNYEVNNNAEEEKPEPKPAVNSAPSLQLSANDYKVGLFGGISDLEISIANSSAQKIDRVVIEVEYMKPNGSIVKSQTVQAENISANGTKTIPIPSSSRGVKVRYHVVSVDAQN